MSGRSSKWRLWLQRHASWLFWRCNEGNYHWRWRRDCRCGGEDRMTGPRLFAYVGHSGVVLCEFCAVPGQERIEREYPQDGLNCEACGRMCLGPDGKPTVTGELPNRVRYASTTRDPFKTATRKDPESGD